MFENDNPVASFFLYYALYFYHISTLIIRERETEQGAFVFI